jgi:outer membrane receptor protein involved in Fe transport
MERKFLTRLPVMCMLLLMLPVCIWAGTTGKISGIIRDSNTGDPLVGANVILESTTLGAATDSQGFYSIINIPPGNYTLKFTMMGYTGYIVENVRVKIDLTTTIHADLSQSVIEAGETVTIVAERPLVQMDLTSSLSSVSADEIESLPVETMDDILEMQAGIVRQGNDLHIRGGRAGEIAFWVDGVPANEFYDGHMGVRVENASIQQLQVVSGTFNAEYGQAMSGIVNIITKEGGPNYTGEIRGYIGDYVSENDRFDVLKSTDMSTNPQTGIEQNTGTSETPLTHFNGIKNMELSLGGPVPFFGEKLTFFSNARYFSDNGYLYGREWYTPQGNPGDSSLVAMNPYLRYSVQGKLAWRVNPNVKVSYSLFLNHWKNDRTYNQGQRYNPYGIPQQFSDGTTHILSVNQLLSANTFYEFRINRFENSYESYVYEDPLATVDYLIRVQSNEELGIEAYSFDPSTEAGQNELRQLIAQGATFEYYPDPDGPAGYVDPSYNNVPVSYSFQNGGMDMQHLKRSSSYWIAKFDFTSQINRVHQFKSGLEMRLHEIDIHNYSVIAKSNQDGQPVVPFEPMIPPEASIYWDVATQKPREFSIYAQDKLELNDLIVNLGIRFDYFDANKPVPVDSEDPNIYFPFKNVNKYKNWQEPTPGLTPQELEEYLSQFDEYTPEERRAFMLKDVKAKMALSPRLGIAYPITDRGVIHFSYGHFFQVPNFIYLYQNPDYKLSAGGGYQIFGNPDLRPQRTVQYEIGFQQQLTQNIGMDVTTFYKDVRDLVQASRLFDTPIPDVKYAMFENRDYGNVRGITVSLKKRHSDHYSAWIDYSFQIAEGTYSDPRDSYNALLSKEEPRLMIIPLNWDQRHTINGRFIYQLGSWTLSLAGHYWTGLPYTPTLVRGVAVGEGARKGLRDNSSRRPSQRSVDLFLQKEFFMKGLKFNIFMNVYNLFDIDDVTSVHTDTGSPEFTTDPDPSKIPYSPLRVGTVDQYVLHPEWTIPPRQIHIGFVLGF